MMLNLVKLLLIAFNLIHQKDLNLVYVKGYHECKDCISTIIILVFIHKFNLLLKFIFLHFFIIHLIFIN